jgi:hypothetical protein
MGRLEGSRLALVLRIELVTKRRLGAEERNRSRTIFDEATLLYDEARAGYPEALFDDVVPLPGLAPGSRILAIGCDTGQATVPFARQS